MDSMSDGSSCMMDSMVGRRHHFISPTEFLTTLVTRWIDRGAGRFHELSWHVWGTCFYRMISLLWQELVGGGGIGKPPDRVLYGDSSLSLVYWTHELLRIRSVVLFMLACEELCRLGLSRMMRRYNSHHGWINSRVVTVEIETLIGCEMMPMDSVLDLDIYGCIGICSSAQ